MDVGCHMINLIRWYLGTHLQVSDVQTYLGHRYNMELEDHALCLVKFSSGQLAVVNVGWFSQETQIKVELFGTFGHACASHIPPSKIKTAVQLIIGRTPSYYVPYVNELSHFVQCIRSDRQPSTSGEDALQDLRVISLAYKSEMQLKHLE